MLTLQRVTLVSEAKEISALQKQNLHQFLLQSCLKQGQSFEFNTLYLTFKCEPVLSGKVDESTEIVVLNLPFEYQDELKIESSFMQDGAVIIKRDDNVKTHCAKASWYTLQKLNLFNGDLIKLSHSLNIIAVNIFGSDDMDMDVSTLFLNSLDCANLGIYSFDSSSIGIVVEPDTPTATRLILSRVCTPSSTNKALFDYAIDLLPEYFSITRYLQDNQLVCIDVNRNSISNTSSSSQLEEEYKIRYQSEVNSL